MPTNAQKVAVLFSRQYSQKIQSLFGSSIVSYLPLWEGAGSVAADIGGRGLNGAYTAVTLGQPGIGDGRTAASFDGSTSLVNWYSAGLNSAFNGAEGTLLLWAKVSAAGVWTDAAFRRLAELRADGNNHVAIFKGSTNNQLNVEYAAGGTTKSIATAYSGTGWFPYGLTWSKSGDAVKAYLNNAQTGATGTGLGTWVGSINATIATLGDYSTTPTQVWSGLLAHPLLLNCAATLEEVTAYGTVS